MILVKPLAIVKIPLSFFTPVFIRMWAVGTRLETKVKLSQVQLFYSLRLPCNTFSQKPFSLVPRYKFLP
ncbi:hypothetical protein FBY04_11842 [Pseudomonas sp. SJZ080]|nr:hypothetical protein FBY04_11842 [Pseudomonas sp. SJZ080]